MARRSTKATTAITGTARIDRRTKDLIKRLNAGDIAVINHRDLDRVAAEGLVGAGVAAVVNADASISGRYPNGGPIRVVQAGIPLIDRAGEDVLDRVHEGEELRIDGGEVFRGDECIATGESLTTEDIQGAMDTARAAIGGELERFAVNTLEYIQREAKLTFEPIELPPIKTKFRGRHALVVVRGHDYRTDLAALRPYIREYQPVLIGVDGGADALLEMRLTPDIIIGDFDSVSEHALSTGAELIHHVHLDGRAPGREALQAWGVPYHEFIVDGTSEDVAMLLAYEAGAQLIVAVGTHATMVEFLDKGRSGIRRRDMALLVASAMVAIIVISIVSEPIHVFLRGIELTLRDLWFSISDQF